MEFKPECQFSASEVPAHGAGARVRIRQKCGPGHVNTTIKCCDGWVCKALHTREEEKTSLLSRFREGVTEKVTLEWH